MPVEVKRFDSPDETRPFEGKGRAEMVHVAGHTNVGKYIIDTHRGPIIDSVWELYAALIERTGPVSTLIEWDDAIPEWSVLAAEMERARDVRDVAVARRSAPRSSAGAPTRPRPSEPRTVSPGAVLELCHGGPRERAAAEHGALDR